MCMVDGDDMVTPLQDAWRKARKVHKCQECRRNIQIGESYHYDSFVFEGQLQQHRTCAHCMVARDWLSTNCGGWIFSHVLDDIEEHIGKGDGLTRLSRIVVGSRRKWARFHGEGLMPPPKRPEDYPKEYRY